MSGFFDEGLAGVVATWMAALVTIGVWAYLVGERRFFRLAQHLLAGLATGYLTVLAVREVLIPRLLEPLASDPGGQLLLWPALVLVAAMAGARWLARPVVAVPAAILIAGVAAFALGGAVVGTLLPQMAGALLPPGPAGSIVNGLIGLVITALVLVAFLHGIPRGRLMAGAAGTGRWLLLGGIGGWLGFLLVSRLALLVDRLQFLLGDWLGDRSMTVDERQDANADTRVGAEMSLLVDVGSAWTKAAAVARSRGRWRIVSHAAQPTGWGEEELRAALAGRLAPVADRRVAERIADLLRSVPRIACHTPRRPGHVALAAVSSELSGDAARRAAESAGWVVVEAATADDGRSLSARLAALQAADVDVWLLAGGFDEGRADQALEMAGLVAAARGGAPQPVVWAGSESLTAEVSLLFEDGAVRSVANPRPSANSENPVPLRHLLEDLLQRMVEPGGVRQLTPVSFRRGIGELARASMRRILGVDLGAHYLTWVLADETGGAESRVFADGGLAARSLVAPGGASRLSRLLPMAIDEMAVADALRNLHARPGTLPQTDDELAVTHAATRYLLAHAAGDSGVEGLDLLVGCGRTIAAAPRPAQAAQLLLDGLRPLGITQLAVDSAGVLPPIGALDDTEIGEGMGVLRDDLLVPLGAAVVSRGGRSGQLAMRVTVHRTGWPEQPPIEVRSGGVVVLPLGRGQAADLEIELAGGVTLGGARQGKRLHANVTGGAVGLILDARDMPLALPRRSEDRRAVLAGWRDSFLREPALPAAVVTA